MKCSSCNAENNAVNAHCEYCGSALAAKPSSAWGATEKSTHVAPQLPVSNQIIHLPPTHVYCRGCAGAIHVSAVSCPKCGATHGTQSVQHTAGKDRITAVVLALILGGLGIHKFYLGRGVQGVLYLLFCWTFIPAVISFIEGIVYLTMTDADFSRKYS